MFFKKLVDKKNDKIKFVFIPKTNDEYISVKYGCIRFLDNYIFLSSSLDSLVKTLIDNSHKTLKDFKEEIVDIGEILNNVNEMKFLIEEDKYNNGSIKDSIKDYPNKLEKIEEALLNYMGKTDLKILKTGFSDKWKYLTKKLAYPYEFFNSLDDYQKRVENLKKEDFFSKLNNKCPDGEGMKRKKQII